MDNSLLARDRAFSVLFAAIPAILSILYGYTAHLCIRNPDSIRASLPGMRKTSDAYIRRIVFSRYLFGSIFLTAFAVGMVLSGFGVEVPGRFVAIALLAALVVFDVFQLVVWLRW